MDHSRRISIAHDCDEFMTLAYAAIEDGCINVKTVSSTRQAAIINWLVTKKGVMIYNSDTDKDIKAYWDNYHGEVEIEQIILRRQNDQEGRSYEGLQGYTG